MRLIGRNDLFLLVGVSAALFTIVSRPLGRILAYAYEVDQSRGQQLLPGLVILTAVFVFHQVRKRHEWPKWRAWSALGRRLGSRSSTTRYVTPSRGISPRSSKVVWRGR